MDKHGTIGASLQMSPAEYRQALAVLGLTQQGCAQLVGASPRTGQKWAHGETRIPGSVALLLHLLIARPELLPIVEGMSLGHVVRKRGQADG